MRNLTNLFVIIFLCDILNLERSKVMFFSLLADIDSAIISFFTQLTAAIGFGGYLAIALGVEVFFILLFLLRSAFSYEARIKRSLDKYNNWLFKNKKLDKQNIKEFNALVKKGPKRFVYFWQQYILFRENGPTNYMSEENLIDKPLKTSSWANNVRNLLILTTVWSVISLLFGFASQAGRAFSLNLFAVALVVPVLVLVLGVIAIIILKAKRVLNLDDIYHSYHIFARFITNACIDLPAFIDYDLLFTQKEISRGNPQLREFYEARARKAKEEFENAKQNEIEYVEYNFEKAGVDGSLVLERAMKESEAYLNKRQSILTKIADIDMQKEALKRNYENTQKELQKKIQATKENIAKLLQQQEATTSRMEVSFLRKQQDQERSKQEQLQSEYDQEETRYAISNDELKKELEDLQNQLEESKEDVEKAMLAEYQSFYEKVLQVSSNRAEHKVKSEISSLRAKAVESDKQLTIVQTQIKRLLDENETLRAELKKAVGEIPEEQLQGKYDEEGNYVYQDGSYHDPDGFFHAVNGDVYDINGNLISTKQDEKDAMLGQFGQASQEENESAEQQEGEIEKAIAQQFGPIAADEPVQENVAAESEEPLKRKRGRPRKPVAQETESKPPRKRGRPRKDSKEVAAQEKTEEKPATKKRSPYKKTAGRKPKKETEKKAAAKKTTPKKSDTTKSTAKKAAAKKSAAKETGETPVEKQKSKTSAKRSPTLNQISKLISEEEEKLSKMKAFINSEIDDVVNGERNQSIDKEKDEIMKTVEDLKEKAENVKQTDKSETELANINKRLEELIKEISELNSRR